MFEKTQGKHPVIVLKDIKSEVFEALLKYMYIGEVNVVQEKLSELINAAECLKIKGLAAPDEEPETIHHRRGSVGHASSATPSKHSNNNSRNNGGNSSGKRKQDHSSGLDPLPHSKLHKTSSSSASSTNTSSNSSINANKSVSSITNKTSSLTSGSLSHCGVANNGKSSSGNEHQSGSIATDTKPSKISQEYLEEDDIEVRGKLVLIVFF